MGLLLDFLRTVDGLQLNRVGVERFAAAVQHRGAVFVHSRDLLGVRDQDLIGAAGIDGGLARGDVGRAVPSLELPVQELQIPAGGAGGCVLRNGGGVILIEHTVLHSAGAAVQVVGNADAVGAVQLGTPAGVEIQLLGDPEAVVLFCAVSMFFTGFFKLSPLIVDVRILSLAIIRCGDGMLVQNVGVRIEDLRAGFVQEPAVHPEIITESVGCTDFVAVADTEAHGLLLILRLILVAPIQRFVCAGNVRVQIHTILDLTPLGVDRHVVLRHRVKVIRRRAGLVRIPAFQHVLGAAIGNLIVGIGLVAVAADIKAVPDHTGLSEALRDLLLLQNVVVAVHILTVPINDLI